MTSFNSKNILYTQQLKDKREAVEKKFATFDPPQLEIFPSPPEHYRLRAEFRVWHEGEDLYYIMFDPITKEKFRVDQFEPASVLINQLMPKLLAKIKHQPLLRYKLFQVDFLSSLSGEIVVSLLYHKAIDETWEQAAAQLKQELSQDFQINLIGRSRKKKICIDKDFVVESLALKHKTLHYKQVENSFTQPNGAVAIHMLEWAIDVTQHSKGDLLELYCGNGNFSIALADNFRRVLATEISKSSVACAQYNIAKNQTEQVQVIRLSAEEFTQALNKEREFKRLEGIDLESYDCNTILVDPPRAGLDEATLKMLQGYEHILYISCNPDTLEQNLQQLSISHRITRFALFDQFPYTHHTEIGVFLKKL